MKLAIVTDSTAFIPTAISNHPDIYILPIPVILDGKIYNEGIDIHADEYYDLLKASKEFPTTSQPALGEVVSLYEKLAKEGYTDIISIHLSGGISGFVNTLFALQGTIEGINIHPFDSKITSMPMGNMVQKALEMKDAGKSIEEILDYLDYIRSNTRAFLIVDDLNNLVRGGRLTNGAAIIGGLLKIKPILTFEDGKIVLYEKIRSSKKAFAKAEELVFESAQQCPGKVKYYVIHANNLEVAKEEKAKLEAQFPDIQVEIGYFGPVIGTHLGEKAIGLAFSAE
ncbi:DegV family protein [Enterococcus cecorum]|uniref:DegV family protein n=1 Tax=Enterococcus cecorum TaxID=44008 RepID=UPI0006433A5B|nr:DegV family protein [Enterococcus cecorum]KLO68974.1 DegV family EDD domain-containing protein [Enterococcus cecorum]CAI3256239.1 DegV family protein [Enterococcus cecorum]CAI3256478.1 DegV family protein [Enterococcus cecorum]CAI3261461.1 DegV family protein [Enterococcus cecorum]CAI3261520.1 DegV family protein [Enterococcus cecorum]